MTAKITEKDRALAFKIDGLFQNYDFREAMNGVTELIAQHREESVRELRDMLVKCFRHLSQEINQKDINQSAKDGTQALSREVAVLLDATKPL